MIDTLLVPANDANAKPAARYSPYGIQMFLTCVA